VIPHNPMRKVPVCTQQNAHKHTTERTQAHTYIRTHITSTLRLHRTSIARTTYIYIYNMSKDARANAYMQAHTHTHVSKRAYLHARTTHAHHMDLQIFRHTAMLMMRYSMSSGAMLIRIRKKIIIVFLRIRENV